MEIRRSGLDDHVFILNYMDNNSHVMKDIRRKRDGHEGNKSVFKAFRKSIVQVLKKAEIEPQDCILVIRIDDLDRYLQMGPRSAGP